MGMGAGPRRGHGGRRAPMAEINVTPLVDVMLVLLIIFMITAPLLMTGVPVNLPDSRAKALDQPKKPIQISINGQGQIYLDDDLVSDGQLGDRLQQIAAQSANAPEPQQIFLRADRSVDYGKVASVMGELNHAGLNKISLVTTPAGEER